MTAAPELHLRALPGIPLIAPGDDLSAVILSALQQAQIILHNQDVLVISSKVVSKAEGRFVDLNTVQPSTEAQRLAAITHKDPRIVQVILDESTMVSRSVPNVLVTAHRLGFISANAGVDQSNVGQGDQVVLLLPNDPDASAESLRKVIGNETGASVGIVISDTHGRPFRKGNVGVAIGLAGLPGLLDLRGQPDLFGRVMQSSVLAAADLAASAAHLLCGEANAGYPVVWMRGLHFDADIGRAADLNRDPEQDLYR